MNKKKWVKPKMKLMAKIKIKKIKNRLQENDDFLLYMFLFSYQEETA